DDTATDETDSRKLYRIKNIIQKKKNIKLRESGKDYVFKNALVFYDSNTYCDHVHMYSFKYTNIITTDKFKSQVDLDVYAYPLSGMTDSCYFDYEGNYGY